MEFDFDCLRARIKNYRKIRKITQKVLADCAAVERSYISKIETGETIPSIETFVLIANALEVGADDLLIDSLKVKQSCEHEELNMLFLDCNPREVTFLIESMVKLKELLRANTSGT